MAVDCGAGPADGPVSFTVTPGSTLVAPSPDTAVILPEKEALEAVEFVPCDCRATVGNANKISAIEIAQKALDTILRAIFIVFAVKSPKNEKFPTLD